MQYEETGEFPVERGYIWTSCASVENGNPLFWDDDVADEITGGPIAPPTMISVWFRPHHWAPGRTEQALPLQVHFDLKETFELPEAVMTDNTIVFHEPVRPGDVLRTRQILRSVSEPKTTKLGTGRFWVIDVEYLNQRDELVGVESYTGFGYKRGAVMSTHATLTLDDVHAGDALPELAYDVTATTVVLGALASARLAADAPRPRLRGEPQRHAGHLPEHAEPGGVVRALPHRLVGPEGPARPHEVPHEGLGVPRRHDGARGHRRARRDRRRRLRLGDACSCASPSTATSRPTARRASRCRSHDDDNPWTRRGDQWKPYDRARS